MSPEDLKTRNYTFCDAHYFGDSDSQFHQFLVGTPNKVEAKAAAEKYARDHWGEPYTVALYPRNYIREARALFAQGLHD